MNKMSNWLIQLQENSQQNIFQKAHHQFWNVGYLDKWVSRLDRGMCTSETWRRPKKCGWFILQFILRRYVYISPFWNNTEGYYSYWYLWKCVILVRIQSVYFPLQLASSKVSWAWQPHRELTSVSRVLRFSTSKIFIAEPICLFTFRIVMKTAVLQLEALQISTNSSFFCHACPRPLDINCHNSWRIRHTGWPGQSKAGRWNSEVSCCDPSLLVTWSSYSSQGLSDLIPRYAHLYWFLSLRWAIILVY